MVFFLNVFPIHASVINPLNSPVKVLLYLGKTMAQTPGTRTRQVRGPWLRPRTMSFYIIMLCTVHTSLKQGKEAIVFYCTCPSQCPAPNLVQCA